MYWRRFCQRLVLDPGLQCETVGRPSVASVQDVAGVVTENRTKAQLVESGDAPVASVLPAVRERALTKRGGIA